MKVPCLFFFSFRGDPERPPPLIRVAGDDEKSIGRTWGNSHVMVPLRFFASTDDGFPGDVYLHEAQLRHPILLVHLKSAEQMEQVRDLLSPYGAYHIKYIGTWTVTDLAVAAESNK